MMKDRIFLFILNYYITGGKRTKKIIDRLKLVLAPVLLTGLILPANTSFSSDNHHTQIGWELITLVDTNPEIRDLLEASIAEAGKVNPDPKTNPVQTLSE